MNSRIIFREVPSYHVKSVMYRVHLTAVGPELTPETAVTTSVAATAFIYLNYRENQALF